MFSYGNLFILLIIFNQLKFMYFILAKNSTNKTNEDLINSLNISETFMHMAVKDGIFPKVEPLTDFSSKLSLDDDLIELQQKMPVFPERGDSAYFIVAVVGGAKIWGRMLARTILDIGGPFISPQGPPLRPIYLDLPKNGKFSVKVLTALCQQSEDHPLAGIIIFGDGQSAQAVALSGNAMKLPVLWAKGGTANIHGLQHEVAAVLQSILQPSAREILQAIRALFIQTHWHSFFVLTDTQAALVLAGAEGNFLKEAPLLPTILVLPEGNENIFKQLTLISRSTRGVVLLLCDLNRARKVMSEAKRLNMAGGHFIWLWADTSSDKEFFELNNFSQNEENFYSNPNVENHFRTESEKKDNVLKSHTDLLEENKYSDYIDVEEIPAAENRKNYRQEEISHQDRYGQELYEKDMNSGTYSFSLSRNSDENIKYSKNKRKREVNQFFQQNIEDIRNLNNNSKSMSSLDTGLAWNSENNQVLNLTDSTTNSNIKLKRTFNFYEKNFTQSSHVLFHHFNDFPVGLLALRPIRMAIDKQFIRSSVRLFALTWAKLEETSLNDELIRARYKTRDRNSYVSNDRKNRFGNNRRQYRRSEKVNNYSNSSEMNGDKNIKLNNKFALNSSTNSEINNFNRIIITNSSYNQNLSGLASRLASSNSKSNIRNSSLDSSLKIKRDNKWWSTNGPTDRKIQNSNQSIRISDDSRHRKGAPRYKGGCFGSTSRMDILRAEIFSKALRQSTKLALSGRKLFDGSVEKPLTTIFELLNLVPDKNFIQSNTETVFTGNVYKTFSTGNSRIPLNEHTKWRRVGLISGTNVQLDTIVWPGGDIVVSGLSARSKTIFRIVTALAPPFVMESDLDEDGQCLRGLACHKLSPSNDYNLTLLFNAIETKNRWKQDAIEHGIKLTQTNNDYNQSEYVTKCCFGLSMDLLDKISEDLSFQFHLYIVQDELFGKKFHSFNDLHSKSEKEQKQARDNYWSQKHQQSFVKEQSSNQRTQLPHGGIIYHSASFERKSFLNGNENSKQNKRVKKNHREKIVLTDQKGQTDKEQKSSFSKTKRAHWNGIVGDLVNGLADMSFAPLSVSRARAEVIDFSVPYFHSGVSLLAAPQSKSEIPLLAFLLPFSPELWIAIFTSLNVTAVAVAIYEWLSPFGLNPWGRQRSKNFSISSALWVMWGLLCGHLVAFKAPKSWPNKFLINVWGGFSVIFIASYTANIAALIAGLFFHNASNRYDVSLLTQRVGAPIASAAESYVQKNDLHLWEHMKKYTLKSVADGIKSLKNGSLDLIMADSPILDYYRATDHGCSLQRIGDTFVEDTYAVGMLKGFPLKNSISALIAKYSSNGYLDILTEKWFGGLPCFKSDIDIVQPRPLGVAAVAGVFLLLGLGVILGIFILIFEHLFYKYTLPILRLKPKGTVWKSRNIMFFSQKLYRFINCVELVSPHHAARELVHTLRQGQIASLFQKSIKRKEDEQRRRRKSKAQFFEMIQEIRRVQQQERANKKLEVLTEDPHGNEEHKPRSSPLPKLFSRTKELRLGGNLNSLHVRRFSTDSILGERLGNIGRRLSRDLTNSPPDLAHHFASFGKLNGNKFDTFSGGRELSSNKDISQINQETKFDTYSGKDSDRPALPIKKYHNKRKPLNAETFITNNHNEIKSYPLPVLKESLVHPVCQEDATKAVLKDRLHEELITKYGEYNNKTNIQKLNISDLYTPQTRSANQKKTSPHSSLNNISLDHLSREDLLKLSESSQSEIHEYLSKTSSDQLSKPP